MKRNNTFVRDDIYSEVFREELLDNDQISLVEEAFMRGFEEGDYEEE